MTLRSFSGGANQDLSAFTKTQMITSELPTTHAAETAVAVGPPGMTEIEGVLAGTKSTNRGSTIIQPLFCSVSGTRA